MPKIVKLKDKNNNEIHPATTVDAIADIQSDGSAVRLDSILNSMIDSDSKKLPLSGGTITGALGHNNNYIIKPAGGFFHSDSTTGAIKIVFPKSTQNVMLTMWIDVYNYYINTSYSINLGGYMYMVGNAWYHTYSTMIGNSHTVRFCYNAPNYEIYIGNIDTKWLLPSISIRDISLGYYPKYTDWLQPFNISIVTTPITGIQYTHANHTWDTLNFNPNNYTLVSDSRLTNARPASDVYSWAKSSVKPNYSWREIGSKPSTFAPSYHVHECLVRIDSRNIDYKPYDTALNAGLSAPHLKLNNVIGLPSTEGAYSSAIYLQPWSDSSGGTCFNFACTTAGNMFVRTGTTAWSAWDQIVTNKKSFTWDSIQYFNGGINITDPTLLKLPINSAIVPNLNANYLNGKQSTDFALTNHTHNYLPISGGTLTNKLIIEHIGDWTNTSNPQLILNNNIGDDIAFCTHSIPLIIGTGTRYNALYINTTKNGINTTSDLDLFIANKKVLTENDIPKNIIYKAQLMSQLTTTSTDAQIKNAFTPTNFGTTPIFPTYSNINKYTYSLTLDYELYAQTANILAIYDCIRDTGMIELCIMFPNFILKKIALFFNNLTDSTNQTITVDGITQKFVI